ncbi:MAG: homoserine dehydrogenase, partial [Oxalobacteraceae bacterium]|nr:homoserine dehydrogenase [Oxalobacteraceae bacterium]
MKPIRVGLLGIGTVGSGTFNVLRRNQEEIRRRAGRAIEVVMVADLDTERAQQMTGGSVEIVNDARRVVSHPDIDLSLIHI